MLDENIWPVRPGWRTRVSSSHTEVSSGCPGSCGAGQMQEATAVCNSELSRDSGKRVVPGSSACVRYGGQWRWGSGSLIPREVVTPRFKLGHRMRLPLEWGRGWVLRRRPGARSRLQGVKPMEEAALLPWAGLGYSAGSISPGGEGSGGSAACRLDPCNAPATTPSLCQEHHFSRLLQSRWLQASWREGTSLHTGTQHRLRHHQCFQKNADLGAGVRGKGGRWASPSHRLVEHSSGFHREEERLCLTSHKGLCMSLAHYRTPSVSVLGKRNTQDTWGWGLSGKVRGQDWESERARECQPSLDRAPAGHVHLELAHLSSPHTRIHCWAQARHSLLSLFTGNNSSAPDPAMVRNGACIQWAGSAWRAPWKRWHEPWSAFAFTKGFYSHIGFAFVPGFGSCLSQP